MVKFCSLPNGVQKLNLVYLDKKIICFSIKNFIINSFRRLFE